MVKYVWLLCGNTLFRPGQSQKQLLFEPFPVGGIFLMDGNVLYAVLSVFDVRVFIFEISHDDTS